MADLNKKELPLNGGRVVEFCAVAAGPCCGMLLAEMGADVVKVKSPLLNRNMQLVTLNLREDVRARYQGCETTPTCFREAL